MADIDDAARGTDAGTKLLNRQPSGSAGPSRRANAAERNEPAGSASKAQGQIDDAARGIDAGTKPRNRQPSRKAGGDGKKLSTTVTAPAQLTRVNYPGAQGKNVWTYRPSTGTWTITKVSGWDVLTAMPSTRAALVATKPSGWDTSFQFSTLQGLLDDLKQEGLNGQVAKLAIVAHGDAPGVVQLVLPLTPKTLDGFKAQLSQLSSHIRPNGKLIFFSCIAGKGTEGTTLLAEISKILPGIYVIGFEIYGGFSGKLVSVPGQIWEAESVAARGAPMPKNQVWLTEYSVYSKWALNGTIIRFPQGDQVKRDKNKCANPTCPGHQSPSHQCDTFP